MLSPGTARHTQPAHPGMDELPPHMLGETHLQSNGSPALLETNQMGQMAIPAQKLCLAQATLLAAQAQSLRFFRWESHPSQVRRYAYQTACQGAREQNSVRWGLGLLDRPVRKRSVQTQTGCNTAEKTRRLLYALRTALHVRRLHRSSPSERQSQRQHACQSGLASRSLP
jgi:hypothetical protein